MISKVFIVGAGQMGLDIGQVMAKAGKKVTFRDMTDEILAKSMAKLNKGLDKQVAKGKMDEDTKAAILANISTTTELAPAADADLVLEAIVENVEIKKTLFKELDGISKPECSFAQIHLPSLSHRSPLLQIERTSLSVCISSIRLQ